MSNVEADFKPSWGASVFKCKHCGVMDIIHAGVVSNAIYCLYLQGIKAMNQKTALFVMINTPRRMDAS